ncbi:MAG: hypothetical protein FJ006_11560 [Chloroflexi bacterium]|nr:hypothetical protein [Chloroflexota bacterium]
MKTAYSAGLQSLALALIFMPEPITTVVGVGLLNYARVARKQRPTVLRPVINTFEDHYTYRMNLINNTTINVQLSPRRHGQMPKVYPSITRLHDNPQALKALHERAQRQAQTNTTPFSKLEPAGLMKPPRPKSQTRYFTPKR